MDHYVEIESAYKGYYYTVLFLDRGYRCGYVGVPKDHFLYGIGYTQECYELLVEDQDVPYSWENSPSTSPDNYFNVHGGITYSGTGYKHTKELNQWWFGFDCAHAYDKYDLSQSLRYGLITEKDADDYSLFGLDSVAAIHRTMSYCIDECISLIKQIEKVTNIRIQTYM